MGSGRNTCRRKLCNNAKYFTIKKGLNEEAKKKGQEPASLFPCPFRERKRDSSLLVYVLHKTCN